MTALAINNLTVDTALDNVKGGWSEVLSIYLGSSSSYSNWSFKGTQWAYQGTAYVSGIGSTYKYSKKNVYERTQTLTYNYESFWK